MRLILKHKYGGPSSSRQNGTACPDTPHLWSRSKHCRIQDYKRNVAGFGNSFLSQYFRYPAQSSYGNSAEHAVETKRTRQHQWRWERVSLTDLLAGDTADCGGGGALL